MLFGNNTSYTRSHIAQSLIQLKGKQFSLKHFPMFYAIYDGSFKKTLLKTSRQVSKSTTIAHFSITESIISSHFSTFIILPDKEQTTRFSSERLGKAINYSPLIKKYFLNGDSANRVLARQFSNGSIIQLSYANDDADRCRGVSCDRLDLDEVQDISVSNVLPVVQECLNNSAFKYELYSGTPKTMENGIEHLWQTSTMTEWVMKCDSCGKREYVISEKQVGKHGPICTKCGALLNPRNGMWIDTNPDQDVKIKGFHVSRLMIPQSVPICWNPGTKEYDQAVEAWEEVKGKMEGPNAYPLAQFRNEVLGMSAAEGRRLVTLDDLKAMQKGPDISPYPNHNMANVMSVSVGIDWSGGGLEFKSRTVLVVLGRLNTGKYRLLYFKIFPGNSPFEEGKEIAHVMHAYDRAIRLNAAVDAGEGNSNTDTLRNSFENPLRIRKIRYVGNQNNYVHYNDAGFWTVRKVVAVDSVMTALKNGDFEFPPQLEIMKTPFQDILNEFENVNKSGQKFWDHHPSAPDDFLHALIFARFASQVATGELNMGSAIRYD